MATHSSVLAWRIPGTAGPGGLPSMGSHRVGHHWSDLAAAVKAKEVTWLKLWSGQLQTLPISRKKKKSRNCKNQLSWFQQTKFCSNHRNAESKEGNLEIGKFCAIFTGPAHHLPGSQKVPHVACIPGLGPWALVSEGAEQSASTDDCVCLSWSVWQLPEDWHMPSTCFT